MITNPRQLTPATIPDMILQVCFRSSELLTLQLGTLNHDHPRPVFPAGPQPRPSTPSVPCRTSTTTIHAQCSLPHLNREYPRQVFPAGPHVGRYGTKNAQKKVRKNVSRSTVFSAGPQPRPSTSVCPAGPQPRVSTPSVPCRTSTTTIHAQCSLPHLNREYPRQVFPAGPQPGTFPAQCAPLDLNLGPSQLSVQRWTSTAR